jgi:pSer/pThr/pTyr-binding forkhead associated (FHA) protein
MPKLTLMLERKTVQVYDLAGPVIRVGRVPEMDIVIDNVSVSRRQAEIQQAADGWIVRDIGSSNGTFVNGERLTGDRPLRAGDEIAIGKYSLFFERIPSGVGAPPSTVTTRPIATARSGGDATMFLKPDEVEQLQKSVAQKRQAHLLWEAGGQRGTQYLRPDTGTVLVGTSERCDVRVPAGPKHHVLVVRGGDGYEVRNLSFWRRMRVNGQKTSQSRLANGDTVEIGALKLTFMDEVR